MEDEWRMEPVKGRIRCPRSRVNQQSGSLDADQKCDHRVQIPNATDMQQVATKLVRVAVLTI